MAETGMSQMEIGLAIEHEDLMSRVLKLYKQWREIWEFSGPHDRIHLGRYFVREDTNLQRVFQSGGPTEVQNLLPDAIQKDLRICNRMETLSGIIFEKSIGTIINIASSGKRCESIKIEPTYGKTRPDFFYHAPGNPPLIIECKIQFYGVNVSKVAERYTREYNVRGVPVGYIYFLSLSGSQFPEHTEIACSNNGMETRAKLRYYEALHFLKMFLSENENITKEQLFRLLGIEGDLSEFQKEKITEITLGLDHLKELVEERVLTRNSISLREARRCYETVSQKLGDLAQRTNPKYIRRTDFVHLFSSL